MDEETHQAMLEQREAFVKKFGREPGPDDPVFFDPDADTPQPFNTDTYARELAEAMAAAGIDPALIYAASGSRCQVECPVFPCRGTDSHDEQWFASEH